MPPLNQAELEEFERVDIELGYSTATGTPARQAVLRGIGAVEAPEPEPGSPEEEAEFEAVDEELGFSSTPRLHAIAESSAAPVSEADAVEGGVTPIAPEIPSRHVVIRSRDIGAPTRVEEVPGNVAAGMEGKLAEGDTTHVMEPVTIQPPGSVMAEKGFGAAGDLFESGLTNLLSGSTRYVATKLRNTPQAPPEQMDPEQRAVYDEGKRIDESGKKKLTSKERLYRDTYRHNRTMQEMQVKGDQLDGVATALQELVTPEVRATVDDVHTYLTSKEALDPKNAGKTVLAALAATAEQIPNMMASAATFGTGMVAMEGGGWVDQAKQLGIDDPAILSKYSDLYGIPSGIIETGMQMVLTAPVRKALKGTGGEKVLKEFVTKTVLRQMATALGKTLAGAGMEGLEELAQEELSELVMYAALTEASQKDPARAKELLEARKGLDLNPVSRKKLDSFILGAVSGLGMGGGAQVLAPGVGAAVSPESILNQQQAQAPQAAPQPAQQPPSPQAAPEAGSQQEGAAAPPAAPQAAPSAQQSPETVAGAQEGTQQPAPAPAPQTSETPETAPEGAPQQPAEDAPLPDDDDLPVLTPEEGAKLLAELDEDEQAETDRLQKEGEDALNELTEGAAQSEELKKADEAGAKLVKIAAALNPQTDSEILDLTEAANRRVQDQDVPTDVREIVGWMGGLTHDVVTGMPGKPIHVHALAEAMRQKRKLSAGAVDLRNLTGFNDFFAGKIPDDNGEYFGPEWIKKHPEFEGLAGHEAANLAYGVVAEEMRAEVDSENTRIYRDGGDELGVVGIEVEAEELAKRLAAGRKGVDTYIQSLALTRLAHSKNEGMPTGVGVDFGVVDVLPGQSISDVLTQADQEAEEAKGDWLRQLAATLVDKEGNPQYTEREDAKGRYVRRKQDVNRSATEAAGVQAGDVKSGVLADEGQEGGRQSGVASGSRDNQTPSRRTGERGTASITRAQAESLARGEITPDQLFGPSEQPSSRAAPPQRKAPKEPTATQPTAPKPPKKQSKRVTSHLDDSFVTQHKFGAGPSSLKFNDEFQAMEPAEQQKAITAERRRLATLAKDETAPRGVRTKATDLRRQLGRYKVKKPELRAEREKKATEQRESDLDFYVEYGQTTNDDLRELHERVVDTVNRLSLPAMRTLLKGEHSDAALEKARTAIVEGKMGTADARTLRKALLEDLQFGWNPEDLANSLEEQVPQQEEPSQDTEDREPIGGRPGAPARGPAGRQTVVDETAPATVPTAEETAAVQTSVFGEMTNQDDVASATTTDEPTGKLEDFGEKIGGARKDYYALYADQMNLAADTDPAAVALSKSWPEPNYNKLLEAGQNPAVVAFIHAARDEIPAKPRRRLRLQDWAEQVKFLRGLSVELMDGTLPFAELDARMRGLKTGSGITHRMHDAAVTRGVMGRADLYQTFGHEKSLKGITFQEHHYSLYRGEKNVTKWVVERRVRGGPFGNMPAEIAAGNTKEEAIARFGEKYATLGERDTKPRKLPWVIYSKRGESGRYYIGKKMGSGYLDLLEFDTSAEARRVINETPEVVEEAYKRKINIPSERRETNRERIGADHREGKDVTPEMFTDAFGFRGVEFGNWVTDDERQANLNRTYDSLVDLATILGVPTRALSLNGELGLGFGSRGRGGKNAAAAHYEPDHIAINLTRKNGPGSLAHEWWHALDNYLSRRRGRGEEYMTQRPRLTGDEVTRAALVDALEGVNKALAATGLRERSLEMDTRRTSPYWSQHIEMAARAFENYVIDRLSETGASNDYLVNIATSPEYAQAVMEAQGEAVDMYPYLLEKEIPGVRAAFDNLFDTIETREEGGNVVMFKREDVSPLAEDNTVLTVPELTAETVRRLSPELREQVRVQVTDRVKVGDKEYTLDGRQRAAVWVDPKGIAHVAMYSKLTPAQQRQALNHEIVGHFGAWAAMQGDPDIGKAVKRLWASARNTDRVRNLRRRYGTDERVLRDEWLADAIERYIETRNKASVGRKLWDIVRRWLRKLGFGEETIEDVIHDMLGSIRRARAYRRNPGFAKQEVAGMFYSPALAGALELKQEKGTPEQMLAMLKKQPGVKQAELDWLGVEEEFAGRKSVTKQELVDFLRANQVEIQETEKGAVAAPLQTDREIARWNGVSWDDWNALDQAGRDRLRTEYYERTGEARGGTRHARYQLPGGENYRELLLQMPLPEWYYEGRRDVPAGAEVPYTVPAHWGQTPNVFAHVRMNDRTGPNGEKVLFVEEVQSDWAREAREKGVAKPFDTTGWTATESTPLVGAGDIWRVENADGLLQGNVTARSADEAIQKVAKDRGERGVPNQPFLKNWHEVAMKRILRMAAEEGYERVAWINGEQTADRYDLSKQIDFVRYRTQEDGKFQVRAGSRSGPLVYSESNLTQEDVAKAFGKDIAQRIADGKGVSANAGLTELSGVDLKIGGEWATNLYDRMIPKFLNKYAKKWGASVESVQMGEGEGSYNVVMRVDGYWQVEKNGEPVPGTVYNEKASAERYIERQKEMDAKPGAVGEQQSIPITPEMRESVMEEGQPLFQKRSSYGPEQVVGWEKGFPRVTSHVGTLRALKEHPSYEAAKGGDQDAALNLAEDLVDEDVVRQLRRDYPDAIVVPVRAQEEGGLNAIPDAVANWIGQLSGMDVDSDIRQANTVFHTGANAAHRLLVRPEFTGEVEIGREYVILDDVTTSGSTLRELREYIESHGGNVVHATALVTGNSKTLGARGDVLAVTEDTLNRLRKVLTDEELQGILDDYDIAETPQHLTDSQARYLASFKDADTVRARLAAQAGGADARSVRAEDGQEGEQGELDLRFQRSEADESLDPKRLQAKKDRAKRPVSELSAAERLQNEKNRLRARLRQMSPDLIAERAAIERDLKAYDIERHDIIMNAIYQYARDTGLRGVTYNTVDTLLKNTRTPAALRKALDTMDKRWDRAMRNALRKKVIDTLQREKMRLKRAQTRPGSRQSLHANRRLQEYIDALTVKSEAGLDVLEKTLNHFVQNPHKDMPENVHQAVQDLFRESVYTMSRQELLKILNDIRRIKDQGALSWELVEGQRKRKLGVDASIVAKEVNPPKAVPLLEQAVTSEKKRSLLDLVKKYGWAQVRPERIIEMLADWKTDTRFKRMVFNPLLKGERTKLTNMQRVVEGFQERHKGIDIAEAMGKPYMTLEFEWIDPDTHKTEHRSVKLNLDAMMVIYAHTRNPGNRAHLLGTFQNIVNPEDVVEEVVGRLPQDYKDVIDSQIDYYDNEQYPRVNAEFEDEFHVSMPKEYGYFPIMNLKRAHAQNAIVADMLARKSALRAATQKGHVRSRINSDAPFRRLSYFNTVIQNMQQVEHYLAYNQGVRQVNRVLSHPEVREAIQRRSGEAYDQLQDWVRAVAYGRIQSGEHPLDKVSDWLRTNYVTAVLGMNIITTLKQPASFAQGLSRVEKSKAVASARDFVQHPFKMVEFVNEKSVMMRNRGKSYERVIAEMAEKAEAKKILGTMGWYQKMKEGSMKPIEWADRATCTILWNAKYQEVMKKTGRDDQAVAAADELIRKTQPMGGLLNLPQMHRAGGIARAYTMFSNQTNQNLNLQLEMLQTWGQKKNSKRAEEVLFLLLVPSALIYMASHGGRLPWKDPEGWAEDFVSNSLGSLALVSNVIEALTSAGLNQVRKARGKKVDKTTIEYAKDLAPTSFTAIVDLIESFERPEKLWEVGMKAGGVPYSQARRTVKGAKTAYETGDPRYLVWSKRALEDVSVGSAMRKRLTKPRDWSDRLRLKKWYDSLSAEQQAEFRKEIPGAGQLLRKMQTSLDTQMERFRVRRDHIKASFTGEVREKKLKELDDQVKRFRKMREEL